LHLPRALTVDEIEAMKVGSKAIYFIGEVSYRDIFDDVHSYDYMLVHGAISGTIGSSTDMMIYTHPDENA